MAQNFYTKWQNAILADAGVYVSKYCCPLKLFEPKN